MVRVKIALLILLVPVCALAQGLEAMPAGEKAATEEEIAWTDLPDSPGAVRSSSITQESPDWDSTVWESPVQKRVKEDDLTSANARFQSVALPPTSSETEPYHWKGLLLQSFAFNMLSNVTRVVTANQSDRHLLLNKPYWSDYWVSLQHFDMHRWNDGDSIKVNYIGHPMEGAIAGYIEVQNDPRGRELHISRGRPYWNSRFRAFLWQIAYSTFWEMGPTGETAIFNQGGFTYPIGCKHHNLTCEATAKYTNNTGWVDFTITPIVGTMWLLGEDAIDRYVSDPLVRRHPHSFGIKLVRASLNPPASAANMLRGRFPWWRDYEHPNDYESYIVKKFERGLDVESKEHGELYLHYSALALGTNNGSCFDCRNTTTGAGLQLGIAVRHYLDVITDVSFQPEASPVSSRTAGGSLTTMNFGVRSGYSGERFAAKVSLAPGFASYSRTQPQATESDPNPSATRTYHFSAVAKLSTDIRFTQHLAFRATLDQMLIRYKSEVRDPVGIGTAPRISFLSHDNYINSTNWGVTLGPVLRF